MQYADVAAQLTGRNIDRRKYANNTYLIRYRSLPGPTEADKLAMVYHETDVITWYPFGDVVLDSGGWRTSTTKERINWGLPAGYRLHQELGVWYITNGTTHVFKDGITIHANGTITGQGEHRPKADKALKAKVKAYAELCSQAIPLDQPGPGDCLYCHMVTDKGQTLGDATGDTDHLLSHIDPMQPYIVPSLVYNALKEKYNAPAAFWETFKDTGWESDNREFGRMVTRRAVYRYILQRLGYAV